MSLLVLLSLLVSLLGSTVTMVKAFPSGAPPDACEQMFPTGHKAYAQTAAPPYTLTVDRTTFGAGNIITLWLNSTNTSSFPVYEGLFVQARLANNCSNNTPVGTFNLEAGKTYLKLLSCGGIQNSAVTQTLAQKTSSIKFTWSPSAAIQGHIFFRATVVFEEKVFWTNVFTGVIQDTRVNTTRPLSVQCKEQQMGSDVTSLSTTVTQRSQGNTTAAPPTGSASPVTSLSTTVTQGSQGNTKAAPPTGNASPMAVVGSLVFAGVITTIALS